MATTLSPAMERAMRKLTREWQYSYVLYEQYDVRINTLVALTRRGLAEGWSANSGHWRLTERGEQWLAS